MKYTNCSKNCPDYTVDCERFDCCECDYNPERIAYEQGYEDGAITEVKKIKEEILNEYPYAENDKARLIGYGIHIALEYIDKHISELKGENNDR